MLKKSLLFLGAVSLVILIAGYGRLLQLAQSSSADIEAAATAEIAAEQGPANFLLPKPNNRLAGRAYTWEQVLERDSIEPIYEPTFLSADDANYVADELVIGVAINGQAKAYPIGPLNGREMINDTLGGQPILVTW